MKKLLATLTIITLFICSISYGADFIHEKTVIRDGKKCCLCEKAAAFRAERVASRASRVEFNKEITIHKSIKTRVPARVKFNMYSANLTVQGEACAPVIETPIEACAPVIEAPAVTYPGPCDPCGNASIQ